MRDGFGRTFEYLRLSVTDVCNFRCPYCLPSGYAKAQTEPLTVEEIRALIEAFVGLGMWKVRLTGGEPTTRRDLPAIIEAVRSVAGVRHLALSTNGYRIPAGVDSVNVSIDSMDPATFAQLTGHDILPRLLDELEQLRVPLKINCVLMGEPEEAFFAYVKTRPVTVRFIQLMQTRDNSVVFLRRRAPLEPLYRRLQGWSTLPRQAGDGPATVYAHPDYRGRIGLIAAYEPGFCDTCNRLRVTSTGKLRLCLFGDGEIDLRPLLHDRRATEHAILSALAHKRQAHDGTPGITRHLAETGG